MQESSQIKRNAGLTIGLALALALALGACSGGSTQSPSDDAASEGVSDSVNACQGLESALDTDGDGSPDSCDPCPLDSPDDTDGDGVCDSGDTCPGSDDSADSDGDGLADACDPDPDCPKATCVEKVCDDRLDDDSDGAIDCLDVDCQTTPACEENTLAACSDSIDNDGDGLTDCAADGCKELLSVCPRLRATATGEVTWQVTFDASALAAGATSCSYTRSYSAVQDDSVEWLCPDCEMLLVADVAMSAGEADCYSQISEYAPALREWIGWGNGTYYRGLGSRMTAQGTATAVGDTVTVANEVLDQSFPAGGAFQFDVSGHFTLGEEEGDPLHGFRPPETYACGWPKSDAPEYTGHYVLTVGETLPDGVFLDICKEPVRLHDFAGRYLVINVGVLDCSACKIAAETEAEFLATMATLGIDVEVIDLMGLSLDDVLGDVSTRQMTDWNRKYGLDSPILADRAYGYTLFSGPLGEFSTPAFAIVAPDLTIIDLSNGFGDWSAMQEVIEADLGQ
ncbi:MAG: hypothetical protein COW42_12930 [Deltaproteobacteria bacterium CG17_big_fil_post_rev_8_21_14_2_50_63_7]|nr:MAG: hypothetical protein COW42_12930 [Deltaproteobacteria bacterium CG17_big_fil_post_rev_8_21_14_2_50_63_7]